MLLWITQMIIISIILIFLVHNLINFFKNTLTIPKIKDLVNSPGQKYEDIFNIIKNTNNSNTNNSNQNSNTNLNHLSSSSESYLPNSQDYTLIDLLPKEENTNMKNELKNFLKRQLNT
jgi:hypothetical protein